MARLEAQTLSAGDHVFTFTKDYIAYHAALNPSDIAVIDNDTKVTYAEFDRHLDRFLHAVRNFELEVGDSVAVQWTSLYPHWLLLLAFETLGIVTFSYTSAVAGEYQDMLGAVDLVICSEGQIPPSASRVHLISKSWFDDVLAHEPEKDCQRPKLSLDAPMYIYFGSGTTGDAKRMVLVARVHENRIFSNQIKVGYNKHSRFLVWPTFALQTIYTFATACIRMGGTCIYENTKNIAQTISRNDVTHINVVPSVLTNMLNSLPNNYVKPKNLTVFTYGGPVSGELRKRANSDLEANLIENYSTNEVFPICTINPDGIGIVFPGVQLEVVDDMHHPLMGQPGRVRVKSGGCINGYEDDPGATAKMFRDGWFYPGDVGVLLGPRSLKLLGRADDLINIGGVKINPVHIEEQLRRVISAEDFCVTGLRNADGLEQLCIALVLDSATSLEAMREIIAPVCSAQLGAFALVRVQSIPRTSTGKAQREKLKSLILELQNSSATT